jgi:GNAT superfamily N-acetyltransferase
MMSLKKTLEKELKMDSIRSTPKNVSVKIRPALEADVAFIFSTWLRSYRDSIFAANISTTVFYAEHHKVVEKLLKSCEVYVACAADDISELYGYICAQKIDGILVVHYAYVKHSFRRLGIGAQLLGMIDYDPTKASIYTHLTKTARTLATKYGFIHSPYIALTGEYQKATATRLRKADKENLYGDEAKERTDEYYGKIK